MPGPSAVDPELERLLGADAGDIEAVVTLRTPEGKQFLSADETKAHAAAILRRVGKAGVAPRLLNIFGNLQSFVVAAPAAALRGILQDRDVASAVANHQPESVAMPPVRRGRKSKSP